MKKYTFFFDNGDVKTEVQDGQEDVDMHKQISDKFPHGVVYLPSEPMTLWINLSMVKCVSREPFPNSFPLDSDPNLNENE